MVWGVRASGLKEVGTGCRKFGKDGNYVVFWKIVRDPGLRSRLCVLLACYWKIYGGLLRFFKFCGFGFRSLVCFEEGEG